MERQYEKLIVWQEAHALCKAIYAITKTFPTEEKFGLTSQMRRAAMSIPTNIAEGNSRRSRKEKLYFITIANGSLDELHYQVRLASEIDYMDEKTHNILNDHIQRVGFLLHKFAKGVSTSSGSPSSSHSSGSS